MHFFANANIKQKYKVFYCHYKKMKSTTGNNNCWYQSCLYHIKYLFHYNTGQSTKIFNLFKDDYIINHQIVVKRKNLL